MAKWLGIGQAGPKEKIEREITACGCLFYTFKPKHKVFDQLIVTCGSTAVPRKRRADKDLTSSHDHSEATHQLLQDRQCCLLLSSKTSGHIQVHESLQQVNYARPDPITFYLLVQSKVEADSKRVCRFDLGSKRAKGVDNWNHKLRRLTATSEFGFMFDSAQMRFYEATFWSQTY